MLTTDHINAKVCSYRILTISLAGRFGYNESATSSLERNCQSLRQVFGGVRLICHCDWFAEMLLPAPPPVFQPLASIPLRELRLQESARAGYALGGFGLRTGATSSLFIDCQPSRDSWLTTYTLRFMRFESEHVVILHSPEVTRAKMLILQHEQVIKMRLVTVDFAVANFPTFVSFDSSKRAIAALALIKEAGAIAERTKGRVTIERGDDMFLGQLVLAQMLGDGDSVCMQMGSGADAFASACLQNGAEVYRVPAQRVKQLKDTKELTTIDALETLFDSDPSVFYQVDEKARGIVELSAVMNTYHYLQKRLRIPAEQRMIAMERDARFLLPINSKELEKDELLRKTLLGTTTRWEGTWYRRVDRLCRENPFIRDYLLPIHGVGPMISARIVATASTVERFDSVNNFVSYFGYDVHSGRAPRMRIGEELGYNPKGQQGVWNFPIYIQKAKGTPLNEVLTARREYLKEKYPDQIPAWCMRTANRWLGAQLLNRVYYCWRHYNGPLSGQSYPWELLQRAEDMDAMVECWREGARREEALAQMRALAS